MKNNNPRHFLIRPSKKKHNSLNIGALKNASQAFGWVNNHMHMKTHSSNTLVHDKSYKKIRYKTEFIRIPAKTIIS